MKKFLNPFVYLSGELSACYGLVALILTTVFSWQFDIRPNAPLSFGWGHELLWMTTLRFVLGWVVLALLLYVAALLLSRSKIRAIDVLGMNLFARSLPVATMVLLTAWMGPVMRPVAQALADGSMPLMEATSSMLSPRIIVGGLLSILCLIWFFLWSYRAYSLSANLKGTKGVVSFVLVWLLSNLVAGWIFSLL